MKTYWRGTSIRVSKFRLWVVSLIIPKKVRDCWDQQDKTQLEHIDQLRDEKSQLYFDLVQAIGEAKERDSRHEKIWLQQASAFSGIDLSDRASEYRGESINHALNCAKGAYRQGLGFREFRSFYNRYRGIS